MALYICVKFRENITNVFRVMERTRVHGRNGYVHCSNGNNSKSRQTRVTVHMFCTSSHGALHLCENISNGIRVVERTRNHEALTDGRTAGRTDTQNFGRYNIIHRHFLWRGNTLLLYFSRARSFSSSILHFCLVRVFTLSTLWIAKELSFLLLLLLLFCSLTILIRMHWANTS